MNHNYSLFFITLTLQSMLNIVWILDSGIVMLMELYQLNFCHNHLNYIFKPNMCIKIKLIELAITTKIARRTPIPNYYPIIL